ncbi:MAG: hypothetical protein AAF642_06190, partial [Pseudomonadota bacterium]
FTLFYLPGGARRLRTADLFLEIHALANLRYGPNITVERLLGMKVVVGSIPSGSTIPIQFGIE